MDVRVLLLGLASTSACATQVGDPDDPDDEVLVGTCDETTLRSTLDALPHVGAVAEVACGEGVVGSARCFTLDFEQPIQHAQSDGDKLVQKLFLTHRSCDAPTLVIDSGYEQDYFYDDELSILFQPNTLGIEHRFQGASTPTLDRWDWSALTIDNGAADLHEIVRAFRTHYDGRFVSSGASKGGITATYHAHLYPDDLDGSIPYVAPASRARIDTTYQTRMQQLLPAPCATAVRDVQKAALTTRRSFVTARIVELGGSELDLELAVSRFDWGFWQYYGTPYCSYVPPTSATDDEFWQFFYGFAGFGDPAPAGELGEYSNGALFYEWLTEHGFAHQIQAEVDALLTQPSARESMEASFRAGFPSVSLPAYDGSFTQLTRTWVRDDAENLLLIYGNFDPWTGGAMDAPTRPSSGRYFVPTGTHAAQIGMLSGAEYQAAVETASRLFGRDPVVRPEKRSAGAERAFADRLNRRDFAIGRSLRR
ncbi:MAG: hypothetical protein H0V17_26205 [Deltaproteobacteria bacterium]|nr:hypothetical protein [Deltaproteobacteria bacterium]